MNKSTKRKYALLLFLPLLVFSSCRNDDNGSDPDPITSFDNGIFITNTDSEVSANGSLSYYDRDRDEVVNDIYLGKNSVPLGSNVYSVYVYNSKAYIVVADAGKVVVVDAVSMELEATIDGFDLPHHFLPVGNGKAYVSQWGADGVTGSIKVVDLNSNTIINTIPTRGGPEQMLKRGNEVYVANSGGFLIDSVVTVINTSSEQVSSLIDVELVPQSLQLDKNSEIWVLCRGLIDFQNPNNDRDGALIKLANDQVLLSIPVAASASDLVINNTRDILYFLNPVAASWTFEHPITATSLNQAPFIDLSISHLGYDSETDLLIGADIKNAQVNGDFILFDSNGDESARFEVGIGPSGFWAE